MFGFINALPPTATEKHTQITGRKHTRSACFRRRPKADAPLIRDCFAVAAGGGALIKTKEHKQHTHIYIYIYIYIYTYILSPRKSPRARILSPRARIFLPENAFLRPKRARKSLRARMFSGVDLKDEPWRQLEHAGFSPRAAPAALWRAQVASGRHQ